METTLYIIRMVIIIVYIAGSYGSSGEWTVFINNYKSCEFINFCQRGYF